MLFLSISSYTTKWGNFSPSVLQSVHVLFARKIRICVVLAKVFHNRLLAFSSLT